MLGCRPEHRCWEDLAGGATGDRALTWGCLSESSRRDEHGGAGAGPGSGERTVHPCCSRAPAPGCLAGPGRAAGSGYVACICHGLPPGGQGRGAGPAARKPGAGLG